LKKKIAILQSSYIPWKGYFDIINSVDEFVLLDDVQYTRRDWRNRNIIKTDCGLKWLSIPVNVKGKYHQLISEAKINNKIWACNHWKEITYNYKKSKCFLQYEKVFSRIFTEILIDIESLSEVNSLLINEINKILGISTTVKSSKYFSTVNGKNERLINICKESGSSIYLSGPAAKGYIDEEMFRDENICVEWMDYNDYPEYPQLYSEFVHGVTILDLIFNVGKDAPKYMKSFNNKLK